MMKYDKIVYEFIQSLSFNEKLNFLTNIKNKIKNRINSEINIIYSCDKRFFLN